jgi:hypothetical protein
MRSRKNIRDPVFFISLRLISQSTLFLNCADKPQVSALNLNRGKFVKKPNDSIRRKFSIDAGCAIVCVPTRIHHFETIPVPLSETWHSPLAPNAALDLRKTGLVARSVAAPGGALAFA